MAGVRKKANRKGWPQHLYQNSIGYFFFRDPRTRKSLGLGRDKAAAMSEARAMNSKLADLAPSAGVSWISGSTGYTMVEWVPIYEELWIARKERENRPLSANYLRQHRAFLERIATSPFARKKVRDITTADIASFLEEIEMASPSTAKLMRVRLDDMFRVAKTKGETTGENPVSDTRAQGAPPTTRERLSLEQWLLIRSHADHQLVNAMNLALLTGMRLEDVSTLKFSDYRNGSLFVALGKSQGRTKLEIDGSIGISRVGSTIADVIKSCRDNVVSTYLIHHGRKVTGTAKPGGAYHPTTLSYKFTEARVAAGIAPALGRKGSSFHEMRSLMVRLYEEEYGIEFAQRMTGHRDIKTTKKYSDLREDAGYSRVTAPPRKTPDSATSD